MHVVDVDEERQQGLAALDEAELVRLLDRVDGVAAGIAKAISFEPEPCAWSRNDEKSAVAKGARTVESTLPPER